MRETKKENESKGRNTPGGYIALKPRENHEGFRRASFDHEAASNVTRQLGDGRVNQAARVSGPTREKERKRRETLAPSLALSLFLHNADMRATGVA